MGAGQILSEQGEGLYQVKLVFGDALDTQLATLATKRTELEQELAQLHVAQLDLNTAWADAYNDLRDKIAAWEAGIELPTEPVMKPPQMSAKAYEYVMRTAPKIGLPDALVAAFTRLGTAAKAKAAGERDIAHKQAEYLALLKKQTELTALKTTEAAGIPAWCADYTEGLTGQVATLEVFGEYDPPIGGGVNIKPGFSSADWNASYGKLQRGVVLSESGFAWNFTMLNPWEKWMPKWRYARILAIPDPATVNLELDPVVSRERSYLSKINTLNAPWVSQMTGVTVRYMTCNALAFEVGDHVVVEFVKEGGLGLEYYVPYVIGFADHPCPCFPAQLVCNITGTNYAGVSGGGYVVTSYPAVNYACWNRLTDCGDSTNVWNATGYECRDASYLGPETGGGTWSARRTIDYNFVEIPDFTLSANTGYLFDQLETYANSNYSAYQQNLRKITCAVSAVSLWVEYENWNRPEFGGTTMGCTNYCPDGVYKFCATGQEYTATICAQPVFSGTTTVVYATNAATAIAWYLSQGLPSQPTVTFKHCSKTYVIDYENSTIQVVRYKLENA